MIPDKLIIAGLPFQVVNKDMELDAKECSSTSSQDTLEISVKSNYPDQRRISYIFNEISFQILNFAGWKDEALLAFKFNFAAALYMFTKDNNLDWVKDTDKPLPEILNVNGLQYKIRLDADNFLEAAGLLGQIPYTQLEIKVKSIIPGPIKSWVTIHEITHALLYEANFDGDHNDDTIIIPLGTLVYLFLRDNDFNWVKENQ